MSLCCGARSFPETQYSFNRTDEGIWTRIYSPGDRSVAVILGCSQHVDWSYPAKLRHELMYVPAVPVRTGNHTTDLEAKFRRMVFEEMLHHLLHRKSFQIAHNNKWCSRALIIAPMVLWMRSAHCKFTLIRGVLATELENQVYAVTYHVRCQILCLHATSWCTTHDYGPLVLMHDPV